MSNEQLYKQALAKVKQRKKFYRHVMTWVILSVFFVLLNLATTDYFWAIFPILAWGIGVAFHGLQVFSDEWEDQEIEKEYERLRRKNMDFHGDDIEDIDPAQPKGPKTWKDDDFV